MRDQEPSLGGSDAQQPAAPSGLGILTWALARYLLAPLGVLLAASVGGLYLYRYLLDTIGWPAVLSAAVLAPIFVFTIGFFDFLLHELLPARIARLLSAVFLGCVSYYVVGLLRSEPIRAGIELVLSGRRPPSALAFLHQHLQEITLASVGLLRYFTFPRRPRRADGRLDAAP